MTCELQIGGTIRALSSDVTATNSKEPTMTNRTINLSNVNIMFRNADCECSVHIESATITVAPLASDHWDGADREWAGGAVQGNSDSVDTIRDGVRDLHVTRTESICALPMLEMIEALRTTEVR